MGVCPVYLNEGHFQRALPHQKKVLRVGLLATFLCQYAKGEVHIVLDKIYEQDSDLKWRFCASGYLKSYQASATAINKRLKAVKFGIPLLYVERWIF